MHSIEIDCFIRQPKTVLSEPSSMQACQSSKTQPNTSTKFANFFGDNATQEKRTEHLLRDHYVM